jgi:hypothetical protein
MFVCGEAYSNLDGFADRQIDRFLRNEHATIEMDSEFRRHALNIPKKRRSPRPKDASMVPGDPSDRA